MKHLFLALATMGFLATSCQVNYEKTKSGLVYKVHPGKGGEPLSVGKFVKFNVEYTVPAHKDTVLNSTYGKIPGFAKVDTGKQFQLSFMELLPQLKVGDSVDFTILVDSIKAHNPSFQYNTFLTKGGQIKGKLSVLKAYNNEEEIRADYEKEMENEKNREIASIQDYLNKKGIKAEKTANGVFVKLETPGDATLKADTGKQATIMYKGYLQSNGEVFDTNMDSSKGHTEPIDVVVGSGGVIPGWEEALPYFGKGAKGTIFVPAMLGYGPQGSQGVIPPFANLVFDIEVKDIKDAPKQQPGQGMNGLTPEQLQQLQEQMQKQQGQGQQSPNGGH
ncbi:MAG: FKBP-type peptidyl-prolyl cis-trans isomerase [Ilyomonas sp.]